MKILQEITDWAVPNHIYFTNDSKDKIFAYIRASGTEVERFGVPMPFRTSGRKFKEIPNTFGYTIDEPAEPAPTGAKEYRVSGSRGNVYTVTDDHGTWTCTCPASRWQRGQCKHITQTISNMVS